MTFSNSIDISTPVQTESLAQGDNRIRETKAGLQELLAVDHEVSLTGTEINSIDSGTHNKTTLIEQATDPSAPAGLTTDFGILYTKLDSDTSQSELFWKDENDNILQITKGNTVDLDLNFLSNNTYLEGTNFAEDGVVGMIKINTDDKVEILKGAVLSGTDAPTVDAGIANMKYVDDEVAALISVVSGTQVGSNTPSVTLTLTSGTWFVECTVYGNSGGATLDRNITIDGDVSGTFEGTGNESGNTSGFGIAYKELSTSGGDIICTVSGTLTDSLKNSVLAAKAIRIGNE